MTILVNSQILDCILAAAKELRTIDGLEAINSVLDHMENRPGTTTDQNKMNDVIKYVQQVISNISSREASPVTAVDSKSNHFIEVEIPGGNVRLTFVQDGWAGSPSIRVQIHDKSGHLRQGPEIPINVVDDVDKAIYKLRGLAQTQ